MALVCGICTIDAQQHGATKDEEDEQSKALVFGTGSHTSLLEPERFDAEYARMPVIEDFPKDKDGNRTILVTVSDMNSWAKERGIKGLSGKSKSEIIKIIQATGEPVKIYDVIREEAEKAAAGKQMLEGGDYDAIQQMRAVIHANSYYSSLLAGAYTEVSILGELNGEKAKGSLLTALPKVVTSLTTKQRQAPSLMNFSVMLLDLVTL